MLHSLKLPIRRFCTPRRVPSLTSLKAALACCAKRQRVDEGRRIFSMIKERGGADEYSLAMLLSAYAGAGAVEDGAMLLTHLLDQYGVESAHKALLTAVEPHSRDAVRRGHGRVDDVKQSLCEMAEVAGIAPPFPQEG
eukprot:Sspe_Gene.14245::Locus_4921_Transcript_1_2_Confidence_0.500_Length_1167::g.14245::m.14245